MLVCWVPPFSSCGLSRLMILIQHLSPAKLDISVVGDDSEVSCSSGVSWKFEASRVTPGCRGMGSPEKTKCTWARAFGSLNILWGHSFSFVGFCHLLPSCRRFLSALVSLHTFNRVPISRKHMNSEGRPLLTLQWVCDSHQSVTVSVPLAAGLLLHSDSHGCLLTMVVYTADSSCQTSQRSQESFPENAFGDMHWAVTETRSKVNAVGSLTVFLSDQNG